MELKKIPKPEDFDKRPLEYQRDYYQYEVMRLNDERYKDLVKINKLKQDIIELYTRINNSSNSPAPMQIIK